MHSFIINGDFWRVEMVDPFSTELVDRTGNLRLATTDPETMTVYLSDRLSGSLLNTVLIHEMAHCVMISCDLLDELHRFAKPEFWVEAEEWICNFIADYGMLIFNSVAHVKGDEAYKVVPSAMEGLVA